MSLFACADCNAAPLQGAESQLCGLPWDICRCRQICRGVILVHKAGDKLLPVLGAGDVHFIYKRCGDTVADGKPASPVLFRPMLSGGIRSSSASSSMIVKLRFSCSRNSDMGKSSVKISYAEPFRGDVRRLFTSPVSPSSVTMTFLHKRDRPPLPVIWAETQQAFPLDGKSLLSVSQ